MIRALVLATAIGLGATVSADAQTSRIEFPSLTFDSAGALFTTPGRPQTGVGTLRLPEDSAGKLPLVVIAHTIAGWRDAHEGWFARELNRRGFATFEIDTFGPRQARDTATQVGAWVTMTVTADVFQALKALAGHPRLDAARAAVVGFSVGGEAAHLSAFDSISRKLAPQGPRFAAHVALYPICGTAANPAGGGYTGAPVLILQGEKDDAGPSDGCRRIVAHLRGQGKPTPVDIAVYRGAYHGWSNPALTPPRFHAMAASPGKCPVLLIGPSLFLDSSGPRPFRPADIPACLALGKGYMMGYDEPTRDRSLADLVAFLRKHLQV